MVHAKIKESLQDAAFSCLGKLKPHNCQRHTRTRGMLQGLSRLGVLDLLSRSV